MSAPVLPREHVEIIAKATKTTAEDVEKSYQEFLVFLI